MNKQIEKFALEAREYADKLLGSGLPDTVWQDRYHEKFAELIVEECRYVMDCNKGSDQHPEWNRALSETSDKIREHLGVE